MIRSSGKKGFTLIELIVVIAILAVLAFLIVPQVSGWTDTANNKVDEANAKAISNALRYYYVLDGHDSLKNNPYVDRGWIFVNQDGISCYGDSYNALKEAGIGTDWVKKTGGKNQVEYRDKAVTCHSKKAWLKYQINFVVADGDITITYDASADSGTTNAGNAGHVDRFAAEIGGTAGHVGMGKATGN
jgi:prepilin-type N-terminal cleavage/methylation domain-containing protein